MDPRPAVVTYEAIKGRFASMPERGLAAIVRKLFDATPDTSAEQLIKCLSDAGLELDEAICVLLAEDIEPHHAMMDRIDAIVLLFKDIDRIKRNSRGRSQTVGEKSMVRGRFALITRIEECFAVTRDDALRSMNEGR